MKNKKNNRPKFFRWHKQFRIYYRRTASFLRMGMYRIFRMGMYRISR